MRNINFKNREFKILSNNESKQKMVNRSRFIKNSKYSDGQKLEREMEMLNKQRQALNDELAITSVEDAVYEVIVAELDRLEEKEFMLLSVGNKRKQVKAKTEPYRRQKFSYDDYLLQMEKEV